MSALPEQVSWGREALWIEGEGYSSSTFNQHGWYQNTNITKDLLSPGEPGTENGAWHAHYSTGSSAAVACYSITITEGGLYTWWIRLNPFQNHKGGEITATPTGPGAEAGPLGQPWTYPKRGTR